MSLILGIHLPEKIYLVSDTRASYSDGRVATDDLIKAFILNSRISSVAAGGGLAASFILNKLKSTVNENTTIHEFKINLEKNLRNFLTEYVNVTGHDSGKVAFIFGGFNNKNSLRIEVSKLGVAMSELTKNVNGIQIHQSIDKRILGIFNQLPGKGKGDYLIIPGYEESELFSIHLDVRSGFISKIISAECFESLIFYPNQKEGTFLHSPDETVSLLEFRDRTGKSPEDVLYENATIVTNFVKQMIQKNSFTSVGGHVYPLLQFPVQAIFPTGDIGVIRNGKIEKAGSFYVENNAMMYELENGVKGKYRRLMELSSPYFSEIAHEMQI